MKAGQPARVLPSGLKIVEDGRGFYLVGIKTGERFSERFNTAAQVLRYVNETLLTMSFEQIDVGRLMGINRSQG